jgi:hypothetical protein
MDVDQQVHVVRFAARLDEFAAPRGEGFAERRFQIREQFPATKFCACISSQKRRVVQGYKQHGGQIC